MTADAHFAWPPSDFRRHSSLTFWVAWGALMGVLAVVEDRIGPMAELRYVPWLLVGLLGSRSQGWMQARRLRRVAASIDEFAPRDSDAAPATPSRTFESPVHLGPGLHTALGLSLTLAVFWGGVLVARGLTLPGALLAGAPVLWTVLAVAAGLYRGRVLVRVERLPLRTGEPLTLAVATTPGGERLRDARLLLRCIRKTSSRWRSRFETEWSQEISQPAERCPGPDEFVEVTFEPPAGAPGTGPVGKAPPNVWWEIAVGGRTPWGRQSAVVLLPVFARVSV